MKFIHPIILVSFLLPFSNAASLSQRIRDAIEYVPPFSFSEPATPIIFFIDLDPDDEYGPNPDGKLVELWITTAIEQLKKKYNMAPDISFVSEQEAEVELRSIREIYIVSDRKGKDFVPFIDRRKIFFTYHRDDAEDDSIKVWDWRTVDRGRSVPFTRRVVMPRRLLKDPEEAQKAIYDVIRNFLKGELAEPDPRWNP